MPPELQISILVYQAATHLQSSVTTRAARLQSFPSPYPMSLRMQRTSRAPELLTQTPPRLRACSASPELLTQTPTRPYTHSTPPNLFEATSLRLHHTSRAPELLRQTPPRLHGCITVQGCSSWIRHPLSSASSRRGPAPSKRLPIELISGITFDSQAHVLLILLDDVTLSRISLPPFSKTDALLAT